MSKKLKLYQRGIGILISIGLIQIMDVIIHAGTNQLEVIRVSSNLMILAWIIILFVFFRKIIPFSGRLIAQ